MWKKLTHRKIIIIWKPIAQTLYIKDIGLVVSEKNVPKNWLIYHYGDMAYNLPLNIFSFALALWMCI